jgi:hypothetical protein
MTTTVKKGAGRPAAAEKTNRHAQRTALPPQAGSSGAQAIDAASCEGGEEAHFAHLETNGECPWDHASDKVVAEARAIVPDPAPEKPMGERTVAELRKVASKLLVPGARAMKRGELLTAILEAEKAQASPRAQKTAAQVFEVAEKSAPATPPRIGRKSAKAAPEVVCEKPQAPKAPAEVVGASKSQAKADAFVEAAAALGWAEKVRSAPDQNPYGVIVGRGNERIAISWRDGVFVGEECYHSHPARSPRKVINASAAKKIMAIPAAVADEEARKVTAHKAARPRKDRSAETTTERRKALPFDPETASDEEVIHAVSGRNVSWTNEISGSIQDAYVKGSIDEISIQPGKSGRSIRFTSMTGFTSVRVSSIVSVR